VRRNSRRERSLGRTRTGRASTCQAANGTAAIAAPTCSSMAVYAPQATSAPLECSSPPAMETSTSTPRAIEAQRAGRGRRSPRRAIIDFQGSSRRMPTPALACATSAQRAGAVAYEKASQPVRKAPARRASSARLTRAR